MGKECCPIPPPPNDEREKRERAANSKRQVLDGAFQNEKERRERDSIEMLNRVPDFG